MILHVTPHGVMLGQLLEGLGGSTDDMKENVHR